MTVLKMATFLSATAEMKELQKHYELMKDKHMRDYFETDHKRFDKFRYGAVLPTLAHRPNTQCISCLCVLV